MIEEAKHRGLPEVILCIIASSVELYRDVQYFDTCSRIKRHEACSDVHTLRIETSRWLLTSYPYVRRLPTSRFALISSPARYAPFFHYSDLRIDRNVVS